jgi:hypothetical protein
MLMRTTARFDKMLGLVPPKRMSRPKAAQTLAKEALVPLPKLGSTYPCALGARARSIPMWQAAIIAIAVGRG